MNQLDDILNCSICLDRYKEPKILPCHHSFCAACINRLKINGSVTCPNCRLVHDASKNFVTDFRTNQLLDLNNQELTQNRENFRLVQPSAPLANEFNENLLNHNRRQENSKKEKKKNYGAIFIIIIIVLIAIIFLIVFIPYLKKSTIYFCNASQFWDGSKCVDKSHYKEYCKASFECNDMKSLLCINNSCKN
ncbi:unnamed protein product [Brachionus calyciflorus]|uniref:RING-type domain-containing protein n=1 Tax=Brachionus calyciflorus TaxID=104777 RepID=A0A814IDW9_9BILA|nr:unnamed protein product [Brachionus calyciflorus]